MTACGNGKGRTSIGFAALSALLLCCPWRGTPATAAEPFIANGGFEQGHPGRAPALPEGWLPNEAYPGTLRVADDEPRSGLRFARLTASGPGNAHLYQPCTGLEAGRWYRVSAWVRGGPVGLLMYQYRRGTPGKTFQLTQAEGRSSAWRLLTGYYQPGGDGYERSAIAFSVDRGATADLDDVSIEPAATPPASSGVEAAIFENESVRVSFSSAGTVKSVQGKPSGGEYAAIASPLSLVEVQLRGMASRCTSLVRSGDRLDFGFDDPRVKVALRIAPRKRHLVFEVLAAEPADIDALAVELPLRRLKNVGEAFTATYDDQYGFSLFGITANVRTQLPAVGEVTQPLRASCQRSHGIVGARFALVAAQYGQLKDAIRETEVENGLPSPMLDGAWARDSAAAGRSYLFVKGAAAGDIDALIAYAQVGRFGAILLGRDGWLENSGHYEINRRNFPEGLAGLRRAVDKIHRAGLTAGVHLFGPSVSTDDPYVTPRPDPGLLAASFPPLAEDLTERSTSLALAVEPDVPGEEPQSPPFASRYLRVGDEIVRWGSRRTGHPFRFLSCERGALGTTPAAHRAGSAVSWLPMMWGQFLVEPDSRLADEVTSNFARVANGADVDFVYVDASDGRLPGFVDGWYYLNTMHLAYYRKLKRDVLYQVGSGVGTGLLWHLVPRAASADGSGDIKGYLDRRWSQIQDMDRNFTRADIGWYYWFDKTRPDQLEYVSAKAMGVDASISLETSRSALETLPQSRQMMEMVGRYERCRAAGYFPASVKEKLREPGKDFKLFPAGEEGWKLYRAVYEEPRVVRSLGDPFSVWSIGNERDEPVLLGLELLRGSRPASGRGVPVVVLNGRRITLPATLAPGQSLTCDGVGRTTLWPGGMREGQPLDIEGTPLLLHPGANRVELSWEPPEAFPGDINALLYRLWPLE